MAALDFRSAGVSEDKARLRQLAMANDFYTSQIDRLQNLADPAWREIADPKNEANWKPQFAHTQFYAEGVASTIIVRDRLGHFRVQKGVNDPTALIRNQLNISRTIASGAMSVMGAVAGASGVPIPVGNVAKVLGGAAPPADAPTPTTTFVAEEARLDAEARKRRSARKQLGVVLADMRRDIETTTLSATPTNEEKKRLIDLQAKLKSYLETQTLLFDPPQ